MSNILDLIKEVHSWRQAVENIDYLVDEQKKIWEEKNKLLFEQQQKSKAQLEESEKKLRETALSIYKEMQDTHPGPGVEIKKFQILNYEPSIAFDWAKKHQVALALEKKIFEKHVKADPKAFPFVEIKEESRVQIAQDLSKILEEVK